MKAKNPPTAYARVVIPTAQAFIEQWDQWTYAKVSRRFKRNRERIADTVQRCRVRLLQKEFIGRWFYKHLKEDLVDRRQAERITGRESLQFVGAVKPVYGRRSDPDSLWRVSDLLEYAGFDYERYFYSAQGHTLDSDKVLRLLNYPPGEYQKLQSLWRQSKLLPAELTEHECIRRGRTGAKPQECKECMRGLAVLRARKLTLAVQTSNWRDPSLRDALRKMRWNDDQLKPFLRRWRGNSIHCVPEYIMRPVVAGKHQGIEAGLLKYAERVIDNEVINDFKQLSRTDDMPRMVYNHGVSPGETGQDPVVFDPDGEESAITFTDTRSMDAFEVADCRSDIRDLIGFAKLTEEEMNALKEVDLLDSTVRQYSDQTGIPMPRVHRLRTSALKKLRSANVGGGIANRRLRGVCDRYGCSADDVLGDAAFGAVVLARTELFFGLFEAGMSEEDIALHFGFPRDRVTAAIQRGLRAQSAASAG